MTVANPEQCAVGRTYIYNPFEIGDWDYVGGGLTFTPLTSIEQDLANDYPFASYGWMGPLPLNNLTVAMEYTVKVTGDVSVSNVLASNGIFVYPAGGALDLNYSPSENGSGYMGAGGLRTFACFPANHIFFIGYNGSSPEYSSTCLAVVGTSYSVQIDITVGANEGSNVYDCTTRLRVPALGIDESHTRNNAFSGQANGYIGLEGAYQGDQPNTAFTVNSLYITADSGLPSTCTGTNPTYSSVLPAATGKISHARIFKSHRTPSEAAVFHTQMKDAD